MVHRDVGLMAAIEQPRGPTAAPGTAAQVPENVEALVEHVCRLAAIERDRTEHADTRAGGLAIMANGLLALAATLGPRLSQFEDVRGIQHALPVVYSSALVVLLLAGICAALSLRLTAVPVFSVSAVSGYRERRVQRAEPLSVQQQILSDWIRTVASERLTYDAKLAHLRRGYRLFVVGLMGLVVVAATLVEGSL
jgi:hypothetical protein